MIIPITSVNGDWRDWVILDLQGNLEAASTDPESGQLLGDLHYDENNSPFMIVGMQILYGKEVYLTKPMAVLEQVKADSKVSYILKGIVQKKITFKSRPKPIVTDVPISIG